jgi:MOSC domain-containing protein YiiM
VINVGSHTFSLIDARRTIGGFDDLWEGYVADRDGSLVEHRRAEVAPLLTGLDLDVASEAMLTAPLTAAWTALLEVSPILRDAGFMPERQVGEVAHLARGKGGVPKSQVDSVEVDFRGVIGDVQGNRAQHGRPYQAVCFWSTEVVAALASAGHPIGPSLAGENVTLSGIDWDLVRPGVRIAIGSVLCEVSTFTTPCARNAAWFTDGHVDVMHHESGAVSRVYATVLETGSMRVGDRAILEP